MHPRYAPLVALAWLATACENDGGLKVHNDAPTATIESPTTGTTVVEGDEVQLVGLALDRQDPSESLTVRWYLDGADACPDATADTDGQTLCTLTLTETATVVLQVQDSAGVASEDSVEIIVTENNAPTVTLDAPASTDLLFADRLTDLIATVDDDLDDPEDLTIVWTFDGTDITPTTASTAADGIHTTEAHLFAGNGTLTVTATDSGGKSASDSIDLLVYDTNSVPTCGFTAPVDGTSITLGDTVRIDGTALDGESPPSDLTTDLDSDLDGAIASGIAVASDGLWSVTTADLTGGNHQLILTVTDPHDGTCVERLNLTVCDDVWYPDRDGDGFGDAGSPVVACDAPTDHVADNTDCDDTEATANPGETEVCDDLDNDCDGLTDDADPSLDTTTASTWYADADTDTYGDAAISALSCLAPSGYVADNTDCDDTEATANPGETEVCDDLDNDCDGLTDDADPSLDTTTASTWYADADTDTYGDPAVSAVSCDVPSGYVADNTDCDDTEALTYPGATELCDGEQNDCDDTSWTDDAGLVSWMDASTGSWSDVTSTWAAGTAATPAALTLSSDGTAQICEGTWYTALTVEADVDLVGIDGASNVVLSGGDVATIVTITTDSLAISLTDLTLTEGLATRTVSTDSGSSTHGGALHCDATSSVLIDTLTFSENAADVGGALAGSYCDFTVSDTTWTANTATSNAHSASLVSAVWDETNGLYELGEAPKGGLRLYDTASTLTDTTFDSNLSTEGGHSAFYTGYGTHLDATGLLVSNNQSGVDTSGGEYYGGAVWLYINSTAHIEDSEFSGNTSDNITGAVYVAIAEVDFTSTLFDNNSAVRKGGAVYVRSGSTVTFDADSVISNNTADDVGGMFIDLSTVTFTGTTIDTNLAVNEGGGIYNHDSTLVLDGAAITNNLATTGGGIWNDGTVTATNVNMGGTNAPSDTTAGTDDDNWGTSASFSCSATACN